MDANGDGEISYSEFEVMMKKILISNEAEQKKNLEKIKSTFVVWILALLRVELLFRSRVNINKDFIIFYIT